MTHSSKQIVETFLVTCARMGDRVAQEQLVSRFQNKFLRHAYRLLGDAEQARDAVQEGWLEILRGLSRLQDDEAFTVWAFRIISRRCARQISGLQKTRKIIQTVSGETTQDTRAEEQIECASDKQSVHQAAARLSSEHKAAIALFYLEEMSVAEVAVVLEIPVGTVKSRLMHARQNLRKVLEGEDHG